jgi:hypothetical protein
MAQKILQFSLQAEMKRIMSNRQQDKQADNKKEWKDTHHQQEPKFNSNAQLRLLLSECAPG